MARLAAGRTFLSFGAYGYALALLAPWTASLEVKAYSDLGFTGPAGAIPYGEAPPLERDDQPVPDNRDALGARLRVERAFGDAFTLAANYLLYGFDRLRPALAGHAYVALEWRPRPGAVFKASAGRRREEDLGTRDPRLDVLHLDGSVVTPLAGPHGLIAQAEAKAVRKSLIGAFSEVRLAAGWSWALHLH